MWKVLWIISFHLAYSGAAASLQGSADVHTHMDRCSIKNQKPTMADVAAQARALSLTRLRAARGFYTESQTTTVPVCFHFPRLLHSRSRLSSAQLQANLDALNLGYNTSSCCDTAQPWCSVEKCNQVDTGFQFKVALINRRGEITGTTDDVSDPNACITTECPGILPWLFWKFNYLQADPLAKIKKAMHKGDSKVLNVYYVGMGSSPILGYATVPWDYESNKELDGVVINSKAVVNGPLEPFRKGNTLVHETG